LLEAKESGHEVKIMHLNVLYELLGYPEHPTITPFGGEESILTTDFNTTVYF
jgi:hypothetical protein